MTNLKAHNPLRHRTNEVRKVAACLILRALMFCTSWSVALFVSQKRFQQFHISFRFLFQVLAFEIFHVIFDRSIVINCNKPFLVHVFKLQHLRKLQRPCA